MARPVYTVQLFQGLVVNPTDGFIPGAAGLTIVIRDLLMWDDDTPDGTTLTLFDTGTGSQIYGWTFTRNQTIHHEGRIASKVGTGFQLVSSNQTWVTATGYLLSAS